ARLRPADGAGRARGRGREDPGRGHLGPAAASPPRAGFRLAGRTRGGGEAVRVSHRQGGGALCAGRGPARGVRGVGTALPGGGAALAVLSYVPAGGRVWAGPGSGSPYQFLPYQLMLAVLIAPTLWSAAVFTWGATRYWRDIHGRLAGLARLRAWPAALTQAIQL